jgi:hypothetical protein
MFLSIELYWFVDDLSGNSKTARISPSQPNLRFCRVRKPAADCTPNSMFEMWFRWGAAPRLRLNRYTTGSNDAFQTKAQFGAILFMIRRCLIGIPMARGNQKFPLMLIRAVKPYPTFVKAT